MHGGGDLDCARAKLVAVSVSATRALKVYTSSSTCLHVEDDGQPYINLLS